MSQAILDELLERYHDKLDTRAILIARDTPTPAAALLQQHLGQGAWLVAFDDNTRAAAGDDLLAALEALDQPFSTYPVETPEHHETPICDDATIAAFEQRLREGDFVAGLAIGSGTINDIVKLASHNAGLPMGCVGTAPSMNGYTSKIAAVLSDGVKTTIPCTAPRVVIADLDVMAQAPYRMIASGLGDLISKPVSNADWQLSAILNDTVHSAEAMAVIEQGAAMLDGVAPKLPARDRDAVGGLTSSLMLSGLAMTIAGSSSPASGGEHLISHFIDMTAHTFDQPYDFHGCQVGVGTLTTAWIYERLSELSPDDIDVEARVDALPAWEDYRALLQERFGPLFEAVVQHAEPGYPSPDELRRRLTLLKETWSETLDAVQRTLRTQRDIEQELRDAEAPVRFEDLGVDKQRALRAVQHCKDIRNRYTILHLAWELGMLDGWAEQALELLYAEPAEG